MANEIKKAKKVTIDELARMVQRGFLEQKTILEEFRAENARDHAKNDREHAEFRFLLSEKVARVEHLSLED